MREILFRGKRADNGEWIYGYYFYDDFYKKAYITVGNFCMPFDRECLNKRILTVFEVIPETVGQYTGLTDKNGNKIFEGDIVKTQPFYDRPYSDKRKSKKFIGVVKYKTRIFNGNKYCSKQCYNGEWGLKFYEDFGKYTHYSWGELWNCEVIGTIHDNPPDLLEVI